MGAALARNIADHGYTVAVYNRETQKTDEFVKEYGAAFTGARTIEEFVKDLEKPRKIILMITAGDPVDQVIEALKPILDKNDIVIDCGNSNFRDTERRYENLHKKNIYFIGCGVSGGEEGALNGPSMMPGGDEDAWEEIRGIFEKIAARDFSGGPCVAYMGENGAGHYVKTVHNGIEYGVMQTMAEAYDMLRKIYQLAPPEIADIFQEYNEGELKSYLFEIATEVLRKEDDMGNGYLIDAILDKAGQKGTGGWTAIDALERGVALPSITEAVYARTLSSKKDLRAALSRQFNAQERQAEIPIEEFKKTLGEALYAGMISAYAQGFDLIRTAAGDENWNINLSEIARIWEGGCIIRADILNFLHAALKKNPQKHLLEIDDVQKKLQKGLPHMRKIIALSAENAVPSPALGSALAYIDAMTQERSSANFIQALRDRFGAHTYERTDREGNFHTEWSND